LAMVEFPSLAEADSLGKPLPTAGRNRQTVSRLRPLRRREARTARPALVLIRTRNPWVFLRRRLFGWYVLFIDSSRDPLQTLNTIRPKTCKSRHGGDGVMIPTGERGVRLSDCQLCQKK
jgi:hypothetical protein